MQLALVADCELGSLGSMQGSENALAARWHMPLGLIYLVACIQARLAGLLLGKQEAGM